MYTVLLLLLLAAGLGLGFTGVNRGRWQEVVAGVAVCLATVAFFGLLSFWGEMLWFDALGFSSRFWIAVRWQVGFALGGALAGAGLVYLLTLTVSRHFPAGHLVPEAVGGLVGLLWGLANWEKGLLFVYGVSTGVAEPILGRDAGFYLFTLPFLDGVYWLLFAATLIALGTAALTFVVPSELSGASLDEWRKALTKGESNPRPVCVAAGALALVLAAGTYLNVYHLLYSTWGAVTGPGWTDVHIRLPGYYVVVAVLALVGLLLLFPGLISRALALVPLRARPRPVANASLLGIGVAAGVVVATWLLALGVVPYLVQWLVVEPNEITREQPYIAHNIRFTRQGFHLDGIEEREFPVAEKLSRETITDNRDVLDQVRLWDPRALKAVYKQFQEIRLYYEFTDVDIDRYTLGGQYREVMVSPREMEVNNLPKESQTFVNRRFTYTHGFGLTLAPVNKFTPGGLPDLLVKDLPPKSQYPELAIKQPRIYYGELTAGYVVANSEEQEFDYPQGDKNAYNHYAGSGGVELSSLWRKFLFGWKFDGTRFFFSGYPTPQSRVLFHRQIEERVQTLAPFLKFDADPYIVLDEGKLYWIVDGYTTSSYYPYSEPFFSGESPGFPTSGQQQHGQTGVANYLHGVNYVRNAVKAVVDAYNGSVSFYVFDPDDPIIRTWQRIYPGLFKDRQEMPKGLNAHVRYPEGFLLAQGLVYAKYHMTDPAVFYNQEDLWVRATEKYYDQVQPVEPYYVMWQPPDTNQLEFILMLPFTPKNRQVLIGWIAGMCDPSNYGRLLAYRFPKEKRVLGTQQVETKIDQDPYLSERLTLWDQRGSRVIRGNVLVIPVGDTILYVEPIYLQAEAAAYPELRLVTVMHDDRLSYAESFDKALEGLFGEGPPPPPSPIPGPAKGPPADLAQRANQAFEDYLRLQGEKKFQEAARQLETLRDLLQQMAKQEKRPPGK
jgi:uncharacterized membrane protein (UPF0182 family)